MGGGMGGGGMGAPQGAPSGFDSGPSHMADNAPTLSDDTDFEDDIPF